MNPGTCLTPAEPTAFQRSLFPGLAKILTLLLADGQGFSPENLSRLDHDFIESARGQRLTPWVYHEIASRGAGGLLAGGSLAALRADYVQALRQAESEQQQIRQVAMALVDAGIETIFLKGADLRLRVYGDAAARPMADLDLLVSPGQVDRARQVLESLGFGLQAQCQDPRPGWRARFRNELHFDPPAGWPLLVDLHWQLDNIHRFYQLPYSALREKAIPSEYQEYPVKLLCPEHLLIHLALHTYIETEALKIVDLALALSLPLNWAYFLEEVARFSCQRPLYIILLGISQLFPSNVPPYILTRLGQARPSWFEKQVLRNALGPFTGHVATLSNNLRFQDWAFYLWGLILLEIEHLSTNSGKFRETIAVGL